MVLVVKPAVGDRRVQGFLAAFASKLVHHTHFGTRQAVHPLQQPAHAPGAGFSLVILGHVKVGPDFEGMLVAQTEQAPATQGMIDIFLLGLQLVSGRFSLVAQFPT